MSTVITSDTATVGDLTASSIFTTGNATVGDLTASSLTFTNLSVSVTGTCAPIFVLEDNTIKKSSVKTFVIDHPNEQNKFLVHACLEGPEAGVYYRGRARIENNEFVTIQLPSYVNTLATNFTVHVTQIYEEETKDVFCSFKATDVVNNKFNVYGKNSAFFWVVYGERLAIETEPSKDVPVHGSGPYMWI